MYQYSGSVIVEYYYENKPSLGQCCKTPRGDLKLQSIRMTTGLTLELILHSTVEC